MLQGQRDLDHAHHTRRALQMSDVGFHRAKAKRLSFGAVLRQGGGKRASFDWITEQGARAVSLDVVDRGRLDARVVAGTPNDVHLRARAGRGDTVAGSVVVHRGAPNQAINGVSAADRLGKRHQQQQPCAFTAHVAVGSGVEGFAAPVWSHRAEARHQRGGLFADDQIHAAGDR